MSLRAFPALLALAAASLVPAAAHAQPEIRAGATVQGELSDGDATLDDGSHFDMYRYRGRAGERLTITLRSEAFDAYLAFGTMEGGELNADETDDDSGGGTDARITVTLDEDGTYVIRANSLSEGETGGYTLLVESGEAPEAVVRPIRGGETVEGSLDASDPQADDDSYYELWSYRGRPGETVTVTLRSSDFDAFLSVGRMEAGDFQEMESDDDGAGGTDARVTLTLQGGGEYVIRANTLSSGETGAYTLSVESGTGGSGGGGDDDDAPEARPIALGQTVRGELRDGDVVGEDGSLLDDYAFEARAGQRVVITLRSGDFDAVVGVGMGDDWQIDDDGAGGTDARIEFTFPRSGTYLIRANTLAAGQSGAYTLTVERG